MQLNELIDSESIQKVSAKTNISIANLEYLVSENFEHLNRVKALGFLLILEREYKGMEVEGLRERIKLYFEEHQVSNENVISMGRESRREPNVSFFKWFVILGLLAGGYYLYTQGQLDEVLEKVEDKKDFFDDSKAVDANVSDADAKKIVIHDNGIKSITIETPTITTINASTEPETSTVAAVHEPLTATTEAVIVGNVASDSLIVSDVPEAESVATVTISTITINPTRGMLWYGFINVDTKKHVEFMKKRSTPFDLNNGRWLLVTGHGYVDIVSDGKTVKVADSRKHYFYIDSTDIKEISKKEFRSMNGRRGW